ncbi:thiol:disulfide interchange protein TlpA [Aureimonas pseudogalii]|uniref:Thiol-disulfide isomerase/thioredoxin n=1 Tax=Aureimonas pseudogalii TaxID=1744844 RepID=A0A7W6EDN7_9HYPH|nr:TlpA disulfide reductase family protein [Aureimonas pseudogalii]MBB3996283.1 thiol-disulfide isomerase/thioredoxin [Aureimonas pseudogalii]
MSDPNPKPAVPAPRGASKRIVGLALAGGVVAGAVGVYVMETRSGNETASAACPAKAALAQALDQAATGEVAAMRPLDTPFDVSAIAFKDGDGRPTSLGALRGQTLLVNLWATWCAPCRAEMPALDQLEREAGDESFAVVPINVDMGDEAKPRGFYAETGLATLPFYRDETMGVFNDLKGQGVAFGLPVTLMIDKDGCARAAMNGSAHWASPDAMALVDALKRDGA